MFDDGFAAGAEDDLVCITDHDGLSVIGLDVTGIKAGSAVVGSVNGGISADFDFIVAGPLSAAVKGVSAFGDRVGSMAGAGAAVIGAAGAAGDLDIGVTIFLRIARI